MTMTAEKIAAPTLLMLSPSQLDESPTNPRKVFRGIEDLAESFKQHGVLEPVLARPKGKRYELVFGHRRLRAAKAAKIDVPTIIRQMSDQEVLEAQLVENAKRDDIHPLEEAEGYETLHTKYGYTVDQIADKVGKSKASVYARMKLLALCPEARKAFGEDKISASTALLVARIPSPALQKQALKELTELDYDGEPPSAREAFRIVQDHYMLRLADAPFDTTSATLLPDAGACSACPKRTGNQRELFSDVKSADVCTDTECFGKKRDAEWKRRTATAKEEGKTVLPQNQANELFRHGGHHVSGGEYVDLDAKTYVGNSQKSYRDVLKKQPVEIVLARDKDGGIHELVKASVAKRATTTTTKPKVSDAAKKENAKFKKQQEAQVAARKTMYEKLAKAGARKKDPPGAFWRTFVSTLFTWELGEIGKRLGWKDGAIASELEKLNVFELRGVMIEAASRHDERILAAACRALGVPKAK